MKRITKASELISYFYSGDAVKVHEIILEKVFMQTFSSLFECPAKSASALRRRRVPSGNNRQFQNFGIIISNLKYTVLL